MQKHVPYDKQMVTYRKVRQEHESISEDGGLSNTGGSDAEREDSESLPVVHVLRSLSVFPRLSAVSMTLHVYSFHVREVTIASVKDVFYSVHRIVQGRNGKLQERFRLWERLITTALCPHEGFSYPS